MTEKMYEYYAKQDVQPTYADFSSDAELSRIAAPDQEGANLLSRAAEALSLSARAYTRTLRVARTLADLDGADGVRRRHIAEAVSFRKASERNANNNAPASASVIT